MNICSGYIDFCASYSIEKLCLKCESGYILNTSKTKCILNIPFYSNCEIVDTELKSCVSCNTGTTKVYFKHDAKNIVNVDKEELEEETEKYSATCNTDFMNCEQLNNLTDMRCLKCKEHYVLEVNQVSKCISD